MKFTEEYLEELSNGMNELYSKCDEIVSYINRKIKAKDKELCEKGVINRWQLDCVYIKNPFEEEIVSLFGDDNDFFMHGDELMIHGKTPNYMESCLDESNVSIPYKWLELEGDELNEVLHDFIEKKLNARLEVIREQNERIKMTELEKAKELLSKFTKEELENLIHNKS